MPTIKIKEIEFYYELHGSGEPLVLVSGYTADHTYWTPILQDLASHFQVLVFDNRAVGQTQDESMALLTAESMADDTMTLIKALGLVKPNLIGQSMGGSIVQCLAARYADQVSKIAIVNSTAKWRLAVVHGLRNLLFMRKENTNFDIQFDTMLAWVFGEAFLKDIAQVTALRELVLSAPYPQSILNQERQFAVLPQFDARPYLSKITAPTLVVSGSQDILSLPVESEFLAKEISGSKLIELDCAHAPLAERPREALAALVKFFLRGL